MLSPDHVPKISTLMIFSKIQKQREINQISSCILTNKITILGDNIGQRDSERNKYIQV